jgi:hypothetical protein
MDWMGLEKIEKFDLFGIQTHLISLNPYGLRANRTSPESAPLLGNRDVSCDLVEHHGVTVGTLGVAVT